MGKDVWVDSVSAPHGLATSGTLLLLDTASLYFRAFYGVPDTVRSPDGVPVNAVRGLLDMIATLVAQRRPTRLVACWDDDWRPAFRVAAIPSYKAHRLAGAGDGTQQVPPALTAQVPLIVDALAVVGIARVGAPGYEADDVIGTLIAREAARPAGARDAVEIVTGDRDLFQLVDDAVPVRVLYTQRGGLDVIDAARVARGYGVPSRDAYADMAILRGDPSDGLPGVPGIGEKTAAALLRTYGSLDGVRAALARVDRGMTEAQRRRLAAAADYLDVAPLVVRVARDAPVPDVDDHLPDSPADPDRLVSLARRWGLASPVARLLDAFASGAG